jgi:NAD-dependent SIR2 family protein deacetylase
MELSLVSLICYKCGKSFEDVVDKEFGSFKYPRCDECYEKMWIQAQKKLDESKKT